MFEDFFASVRIIGLHSFRSEPDILKNLVHLKEEPSTPGGIVWGIVLAGYHRYKLLVIGSTFTVYIYKCIQ